MEEKIAHYRRLIADEPRHINAYLSLGSLCREAGRPQEAIEAYAEAARLLAEGGKDLEATATCRAIFEIDPHHLNTQLFLARLYANLSAGRVAQVIERGPAPEPPPPEEPIGELIVLTADDAINEIGDDEMEIVLGSEDIEPMGHLLPEFDQPAIVLDNDDLRELLEDEISLGSLEGEDPLGFGEIEDLIQGSIQSSLDSPSPISGETSGGVFFEGAAIADGDSTLFGMGTSEAAAYEDFDEIMPQRMEISGVDIPPTPLFSRLPPTTFMALLKRMDMRRVRAGECIINENVKHSALFIILSGRVRIERRTPEGIRVLATMGRGEFFGEFELLTGQSSKVVVRAEVPVALLEISQALIDRIAQKDPTIWEVLWNFYHERLLNNLLAGSNIFGSLNGEERAELAQAFGRIGVLSGDVIIEQGQVGEGLYLIASGEVRVEHGEPDDLTEVAVLREGDFFGMISAVTTTPAKATVRASRDSELLFLSRDRLTHMIERHPEIESAFGELVAYREVLVGSTGYATMGVPK